MTTITEPGVIPDMPEDVYHADPVEGGSLSHTGAVWMLDTPARFRHNIEHRVDKKAFDVGHAVHGLVLGTGSPVVEIPEHLLATNGAASTAAAKAFIAKARLDGQVPLKADELAPIRAMAEAVLSHRIARSVFEREGVAEASAFAQDPVTGVWLRVRPDFLENQRGGRTLLADLKTARSASPRAFGRSAGDFGYHQQDDMYSTVVRLARGDHDTAFVFVVVEVDPPHLVNVMELDAAAKRIGAERNRRAIDLFARCKATGEWPGYREEVALVALPKWAEYEHEDLMEMSA